MNVQSTSMAALRAIEPKLGKLHEDVLLYLYLVLGASDSEMQQRIPMPPNTQRPRRRELVQLGLVKDSGHRRINAGGRKEIVWVLA